MRGLVQCHNCVWLATASCRSPGLCYWLQVGLIGEPADLTYNYDFLGGEPAAIAALAKDGNPFLKLLKEAKHPVVIVGPGVLNR